MYRKPIDSIQSGMRCPEDLRNTIQFELTPLIDSDYVLLDLPYYPNIGDALIWSGELQFLETLPYKCRYSSSIDNFRPEIRFPDNVMIIIQGGGNFGDLWRHHTEFILAIVRNYPDNRILMFPNTLFYSDSGILENDARIINGHGHLTLCFRDTVSMDMARKKFNCGILLIPDMAFFLSGIRKKPHKKERNPMTLILRRDDKEKASDELDFENRNIRRTFASDWPTLDEKHLVFHILDWLRSLRNRWSKIIGIPTRSIIDWYSRVILRPRILKIGIDFISSYEHIYTTRLHGAVLAILLGIPVTLIDNSYGKCSSLYNTWLKDIPDVEMW